MDTTLLVRCFQGIRDLPRNWKRFVNPKVAAGDQVRERLALNKFEDDPSHAVDLLKPIDGCNIGMVERGQYFGLSLKTSQALRVVGNPVRQNLDRDVAFETGVGSAVDDTHAAFADARDDGIGTELRPRTQ